MTAQLALKTPSRRRKFANRGGHCPILPTDSSNRTTGSLAEEHTITGTNTASPPGNTALRPLVAQPSWTNQSPLDSHNTVATPRVCPSGWDPLLANALFLGHPQVSEHPISIFDEGMANGTFTTQNCGPDLTQSQLAQSHLLLPQFDWVYNEAPLLTYNNKATIPVSTTNPVYPQSAPCVRIGYQPVPPFQVPPDISRESGFGLTSTERVLNACHDALCNAPFRTIHLPATSRALPSQPLLPRGAPSPEERSYDRPGKKRASHFQPDPLKLQESCRRAGGSAFAVDWIISTFKYGVTTEALLRAFERKEVDEMDFLGGFEPHQAYDGFISKVGGLYECGLCKEGKRTQWKNKKDAPRHLRKFHFGLADVCRNW